MYLTKKQKLTRGMNIFTQELFEKYTYTALQLAKK